MTGGIKVADVLPVVRFCAKRNLGHHVPHAGAEEIPVLCHIYVARYVAKPFSLFLRLAHHERVGGVYASPGLSGSR